MEESDLLKKLYDDVVGWLKYAESKNAALAAFAAGSLYASVNLATSHGNGLIGVVAGGAAAFFLLTLTMASVSFLPITNLGFLALFGPQQSKKAAKNLFFFAGLADLSEDELLTRVRAATPATDDDQHQRLTDLAAQVIVNSRIARHKLAFFEWGTWLYISGLLTPVVAFLLFWISGGPARQQR